MGRPSTYTEETATDICERLASGIPLEVICRDEGMPHPTTFRRWCDAEIMLGEELLAIAYARARDAGFDAIAVECLDIADNTANDTIKDDEDGTPRPNSEWITRSRLRVDTRLKLLAKWDPKRYGDRQLIGSDPENPLPGGFDIRLLKGPLLQIEDGTSE